MLGKPLPGKKTSSATAGAGAGAGDARFLHEIEALSKALSLDPKPHRRSLPSSSSSRSISAGRSHPSKPSKKPSSSSSSSSSSIWNWKPFRALSHIGRHRFECLFTLHVHSVDAVPQSLAGAGLAVHWRRTTDPSATAARTRTARAVHCVAEFDETLTHICSVYASRGSGGSAKYEARHVLIYVAVNEAPGLDLGRHLVDLTRILPLSLEELAEEEKASGRWSTSFKLSGKAKGAVLNVSLGYSLVGNQSKPEPEKKVPEIMNARVNRPSSTAAIRDHDGDDPSSMEDVKVLHAVLPSSNSDVSGHADVHKELVAKLESLEVDFIVDQEKDSPELKVCPLPVVEKEMEEKEADEPPEFMVVEHGVELARRELGCDEVDISQVDVKSEEAVDGVLSDGKSSAESNCILLPEESMATDLESSVLHNLSAVESEDCLATPPSKDLSYNEVKSNYRSGGSRSKSLSLDDAADSVAAEFLTMLGIEHSPFGLSSDSDPESPRERLWKQFKMESLADCDSLFGLDIGVGREFEEYSEDIDLSSIVLEAETELQKATQAAMDSKSRAKMMEDAETEALMREWGLNEKAFQHSPPGSRSGFGSPIALPPEEPIALPPLGEGLGPFLQTKDGGFLRSMSPSLFKNAKNNGGLVMQVSSPLVVPAEMGSGIMDILQNLASVGIEKLSMQANKLMPLEDITGKTMQQIAWETAPTLEMGERQDLLQYMEPEVSVGTGRARKKGKGLDLASSVVGGAESEYVSLEDLAPLAMDKIEALSVEGLRIQSGMSDEEAPLNISAQSIGEISTLQGKGAKNSMSLGLEGAGGLQLLDVSDNNGDEVDGLMGLSITLDEWMKLDSGIVEEDQISDRTSKILAAHHANPMELVTGISKGERKGGKRTDKRWGLLGNNFTVALMVQLRDPLRNYEPVGTPMLALIQVERIFVPPKPKIYCTVSDKGNSEIDDELETKPEAVKEDKKEEEEVIPQFKITEVHVAGMKTEPGKKKAWGTPLQQQSGSRWLLASGMGKGKGNKHPFMKSKPATKTSQATATVQPGDTLWSISSRVHGTGAKWKELAALNPHIRNPNVIFPNETIRLR